MHFLISRKFQTDPIFRDLRSKIIKQVILIYLRQITFSHKFYLLEIRVWPQNCSVWRNLKQSKLEIFNQWSKYIPEVDLYLCLCMCDSRKRAHSNHQVFWGQRFQKKLKTTDVVQPFFIKKSSTMFLTALDLVLSILQGISRDSLKPPFHGL